MLKEVKSPTQGNDLIGLIQISLMEAGIRNLPKMAKICLYLKGKLLTFNLTTGIETFPNPEKKPSIHPRWDWLGFWVPPQSTSGSGFITTLGIRIQL